MHTSGIVTRSGHADRKRVHLTTAQTMAWFWIRNCASESTPDGRAMAVARPCLLSDGWHGSCSTEIAIATPDDAGNHGNRPFDDGPLCRRYIWSFAL